MKTGINVFVLSLCAAFAASATAAENGEWQAVKPGIVERHNADGSISRAGSGKAAAQYRYEQIKARIAQLQSDKDPMANLQEIRAQYAALGAMEALLKAEFQPHAPAPDGAAAKTAAGGKILAGKADYTDFVCGIWLASFWSQYTTNATTATINSQTLFPAPSGFGPPPPVPTVPWTSTSNSAFLTTAGGTWDMDYQWSLTGGPGYVTTTKSASRTGYCDGYSLGEVSIACPSGANDYLFYERTHYGCP